MRTQVGGDLKRNEERSKKTSSVASLRLDTSFSDADKFDPGCCGRIWIVHLLDDRLDIKTGARRERNGRQDGNRFLVSTPNFPSGVGELEREERERAFSHRKAAKAGPVLAIKGTAL